MARWAWLVLGLSVLAPACSSTPTSVLLRIQAAAGLPAPEELRLTVFGEAGLLVADRHLPACADGSPCSLSPTLPSEVVLYPRDQQGNLRILVRALRASAKVGEGATSVLLVKGQQVTATVILQSGSLPDQDHDGVPDVIDLCPATPNPTQGPCTPPADAGVDADGPPGDRAGGDVPRVDRRIDSPMTDTPRRDAPKLDAAKLDAAKTDAAKLDAAKTDAPKLDAAKTDAPKPTDGTCSCPLGCKPLGCKSLVAANGYVASSYAKIGPLSGSIVVNTSQCKLAFGSYVVGGTLQPDASGQVTGCVIAVEALVLPVGSTLAAAGPNPLVLLASQQVKIDGMVDVGGHGNAPGPGGGAGGIPTAGGTGQVGGGVGGGKICSCGGGLDDCGGGGGGHGSAGGVGGPEGTSCPTLPLGGPAHGVASLVPLSGGSGGASGDSLPANVTPGKGGGGGGALQVSCHGTIEINGAIRASGGGGQPGSSVTSNQGGIGGGGGGAGGAILLEAASISGAGVVAANGGGGAGAGATGGPVGPACAGPGGGGQDGSASLTQATGGTAICTKCGNGGDGATGGAPAAPGGGGQQYCGGGGGGGAPGRIRFNWYNHGPNPPTSASGVSSTGEVQTN